MEFPSEVDCVIVGTGVVESIVSASLSILGVSVLHIDRNPFYGGHIASLRFTELDQFLNTPAVDVQGSSPVFQEDGSLILKNARHCMIKNKSVKWFVPDDQNNGLTPDTAIPPVVAAPVVPPAVLQESVGVEGHQVESSEMLVDLEGVPSTQTPGNDAAPTATNTRKVWTRSRLLESVRRVELDLMPKLIYCESPTVTTMLRADVTRYLEFRHVTRLLAYTVQPSSSTSQDSTSPSTTDNTTGHGAQASGISASLVQIPVCRSDVFKTRLLSLRQKRILGAFFEWCFHLPLESEWATDASTAVTDEDFLAYANRPLRDLLSERKQLDTFTQQLVITNLAMCSDHMATRQAMTKLRRLLLSMNRFGPYPLLWPIYGLGDLPQAYSRMSAVFGGIFCLSCGADTIRDDTVAEATVEANQSSERRRKFKVDLSTGHRVRCDYVILGADAAPAEWTEQSVSRWAARAVLLTDASIFPEDRKPIDVSLLAFSLSGRGDDQLDPAFLLELPTDQSTSASGEVFVVHLTATVCAPCEPEQLFLPLTQRLFRNAGAVERPKILWAGYFCLPDFSQVNQSPIPQLNVVDSHGIYVAKGPDVSYTLDSTSFNAESLFRAVYPSGQTSNVVVSETIGSSDGPHVSSLLMSNGGSPNDQDDTGYVTLASNWDGIFPPRPPRPEQLLASHQPTNEVTISSTAALGDTV